MNARQLLDASLSVTSLLPLFLFFSHPFTLAGEGAPISYRLGERDGRRVIESSEGQVIPWMSYSLGEDTSLEDWQEKHVVFLESGVSLYQLCLWQIPGGGHFISPFFSMDGTSVTEPSERITWPEQVEFLLARDPEARFMMRFGISTHPEWRKENLDQFQTLLPGTGAAKDGHSILGSLASDLYLERTLQMIRDTVSWCERQPWRNRIVGYSIFPYGEGTTENALFGAMFDNSPVMNQAFREFLRDKYSADDALRQAWGDDLITFETATVPTLDEWRRKKAERNILHWPEPDHVRRERDYFELQKRLFHRFWSRVFDTMLEATAERPVIKGYDILKQHMQGWLHDADFDAKWAPDTLDSYAHVLLASGSLGAAPLLDHPGLDLLQTPGMYYNRAMGYAWEAEGLSDSLLLRGKLNFMEADMRTWVRRTWRGRAMAPEQQIADAGVFMTPDEMRAGFNRTHAWALTRNQMYYFASVCGANWWYHEPPITDHIADLAKTPSWSGEIPWGNTREVICLVIDDESALHEDFSSGFQYLAVYRQIEEGLALSGVPYRIHLLSDLTLEDFPEYRTYLFPNLFKIDADTEALLRRRVLRNGNVAIFGPGTGITDGETLSPVAASRIFGVEMELLPKRVSRRVILQDHGHPISARLDTTTFGDTYSYGPLLVPAAQRLEPAPDKAVTDGVLAPTRVTPLGAGFYHYFFDRPGPFAADFGRGGSGSGEPGNRTPDDYTVIFVPTVPIPPEFLRECARYAGGHIWVDRNAVVYAAADMVALHVGGAGTYVLNLPRPAVVTELFSGRLSTETRDVIHIEAEGPLTRIYSLEWAVEVQ